MKNKYRILIVEDDEVIARSIQKLMGDWGWEACCVEDFSKVLDTFASYNPHLVILDIALPACNGFYWCMEIRKISRVPVVFLSSASDNMNIVIAMNMGGDDFIAKPLRFPVFIARVKALLKRTSTVTELAAGGITINTAAHTVKAGAAAVSLTPREYELLLYLAQHLGSARTRQQILQDVWKSVNLGEARTVDTHIKNLRMKLGQCGAQLKTIRGSGYLLKA